MMKIRNIVIHILCATMICSCRGRTNNNVAESDTEDVQIALSMESEPVILENISAGEFELKEDVFGKIIELKGTNVETDDIFKVSETETICIDSLLIMNNRERADGHFLSVYSLPSLTFIKSLGNFGRGPGEFNAPHLVPVAKDENALCYLTDIFSGEFQALTNDLELQPFKSDIPEKYRGYTSEKMYTARNKEEMVFSHANSIMHYLWSDSLGAGNATRLCNLSLAKTNPNVSYIGSLGVNYQQERFVYAYKFVKRIVFGDFDGNVRALQFGKPRTDVQDVVSADYNNVTHYWKIYTTPEYVYVSYSGRTPVEVANANEKGDRYIHMEVFDWNGNPVKKYKLDRWGYFTVDELRNTLYVISAYDELPFVAYELQ